MIVIPERKAYVLSREEFLRIPQELDLGAKWVNGGDHAAVRITPRAKKVFDLFKLDAPHPIDVLYTWPGHYAPMAHQRETARFLSNNHRAFCLNGLGSGKTLAALWAADFLLEAGAVDVVYVVSPLSTVRSVWGAELFQHFAHRRFTIAHGDRRKRVAAVRSGAEIVVLNHDGLKVLECDLRTDDKVLWIIDESAVLRNAQQNQLYRAADYLFGSKRNSWVWMMTATPMPNSPTDIWAQQRLIDPSRVPKFFGRFRDEVMIRVNDRIWTPRPGWEQVVYSKVGPAIRIATEDCVDLPDTISIVRDVDLSATQQKAYDALVKHCMALHEDHKITAVNEGVLLSKLLQVTTGAVYSEEHAVVELTPKHKLDALKEVVEESGRKLIVFTPFVHSLQMLQRELAKDYSVEVVYGAISSKRREEIFKQFQHGDLQVLVAHPECMAHGLTLTAACTICWYTPTHSNEIYEQANGRIRRIGQTKKQTILHLVSTDIERRIIQKLKLRQKLQNVLLEMLG